MADHDRIARLRKLLMHSLLNRFDSAVRSLHLDEQPVGTVARAGKKDVRNAGLNALPLELLRSGREPAAFSVLPLLALPSVRNGEHKLQFGVAG